MTFRRILAVWAGLLVLLALTVAASFAPLGAALPFVSYAIAAAKCALVIWFFMEMRGAQGLHQLAFSVGFLWTLFLLVFLAADVLSRSWLGD